MQTSGLFGILLISICQNFNNLKPKRNSYEQKFYSFLILFVLGLFSAQIYSQNLIAGWDGDGVTGENSKPNDVGWLSSVDGVPGQLPTPVVVAVLETR